MNDALSVYIHVPFCASKCLYCDFVSYVGAGFADKYFEALEREINQKRLLLNADIETVYIGGGTPSFVDEKYIARSLEALCRAGNLKGGCEISIEANPNSLTSKKLGCYTAMGINRISLGIQSFNDRELAAIGRAHTSMDAYKAIDLLHGKGISDFNLDLMFSLPLQTEDSWERTLKSAVDSGASHLSVYSLILEEDTPLAKLYSDGVYCENEELDRRMYQSAADALCGSGYVRYEISNYAKKGAQCRHNEYCWEMKEYLGFGAAAHSFYNKKRFFNTSNLKEYISCGNYLKAYEDTLRESDDELMGDFIMLALRTVKGIDCGAFRNYFGREFYELYSDKVQKWVDKGLLYRSGSAYALTKTGLDFASLVMRDFI